MAIATDPPAPILSDRLGSPEVGAAVRIPVYKVIVDDRFVECRACAVHAKRRGLAAHTIAGDIRALWYDDLYHHWRTSSDAVAGVTTVRSLFCLAMFAGDAGRRVVAYAEHVAQADGAYEHRVWGTDAVRRAKSLAGAGPSWPAEVVEALLRCNRLDCRPIRRSVDPLASPAPLVSWIIAPVERAAGHFV